MPMLAPVAPVPAGSPSCRKPPDATNTNPSITTTGRVEISPNKFPVVLLDVDTITDAVAARLATSLLGHVLFLKGQVPLPVMQLSRMPSAQSTARALKQRNELLSSYDTLTSHFNTTFTALSSAFAATRANTGAPGQVDNTITPDGSCAYLAILVGSSISSASSKVILAIDGLETKAIGIRDDIPPLGGGVETDSESEEEGYDKRENDGDEDGDEGEDEDEDVSTVDDEDDDDEDEEDDHDDSTDDELESINSPPRSEPPSPQLSSYPTYAAQQKTLQAVERLLSKTLAVADAEGNGLSADMSPTQTHILLRAPRRFSHPAWIPRQNISTSLENSLDEFLAHSSISTADNQGSKGKKTRKAPVWGVWVTRKDGLESNGSKDGIRARDDDEWDEMIWWSWDGKLVGFSEW